MKYLQTECLIMDLRIGRNLQSHPGFTFEHHPSNVSAAYRSQRLTGTRHGLRRCRRLLSQINNFSEYSEEDVWIVGR